ncbi:MAG: hypothetical protein IT240_03400 [Bacteroidia bacterium]|nr:hypothetical protein [Bacteroidia bacterium]MCC6768066.1 hypothetical protein [Bacteroidia bacterium]
MKKFLFVCLITASSLLMASCKKCYDCTRKCGNCTHATLPPLAGCTGDDDLDGKSVEAWKIYLETNYGYTCVYNNTTEEACGKDDKQNKEKSYYECLAK